MRASLSGPSGAQFAQRPQEERGLVGRAGRHTQRAGDSDIGRLAFPSFLRSIESRRENLRATLKEIERERVTAQVDLNAAFQDLKSLEFATEQQAKRVAEIESRRSQSRLDEMALVRHLRKHALRSA